MSLIVNEIFHSIQGESSYAGLPCVFVRLTGCNLRCAYCDTAHAFFEGRRMPVDEVVAAVRAFACPLVEITGGEPLLQDHTPELVGRLLDLGLTVLLETNGSLDIDRVDRRCHRIMDWKCPSSGEHRRNDPENLARLVPGDQVKFVLANREDYDHAKPIISRIRQGAGPGVEILLSPVFDRLSPALLASWMLADRLPVRFQAQLHKIIWSPDARGV